MSLMQLLFSYHGRIRRSQWWLGWLGTAVVSALLVAIARIVFPVTTASSMLPGYSPVAGLIASAIYLVQAWILFALHVKRFHDRDKTGWFVLIGFIPVIGWIWLLIELGFLEGASGPNKYGASPKVVVGAPAHA